MAGISVDRVPRRIVSVQGLRGLAVVVVILVHLHHTEAKYVGSPGWLGAWNSLGIAGVDIFLVVSGFVLTYLAIGHFGDSRHVKSYVYARVTRLYPMYILLTLLLVPVYLVAPTLFNSAEGHQVSLWRSLLLVPDVRLPLISVAWTLHHELYFYIVLGVMLMFPQRHLPLMILTWAAVTTALVVWGQSVPRAQQGAFERVFFNPINFEFILGMAAAWHFVHSRRCGALAVGVLAVVWAVVGVGLWVHLTGQWWVSDFWRVWIYGVPATLLIWSIVAIELGKGPVFMRALAWIGDGAYSIYLSHLMVLVVVGRVWQELGLQGSWQNPVFLVVSMGMALFVGYWLFLRVEAPILRWLRLRDPLRPKALAGATSAR
jgi:exopolysaccharide production protein ExoZ